MMRNALVLASFACCLPALPALGQQTCLVGDPLVLGAEAPDYPLLDPGSPGHQEPTLWMDYLRMLEDLHEDAATPIHPIGGQDHLLPPWFDLRRPKGNTDPFQCEDQWLHQGPGILVADPSLDPPHYLIVSDELSELALVTAMGTDGSTMKAIDRTIDAMESSEHVGMPCWLAEFDGTTLACSSQDTATDATVRIALAYYLAAANPHASFDADRSSYREKADALAARHLEKEYRHLGTCLDGGESRGRPVCHLVAGGANVAAPTADAQMWDGYFQDVLRLLLAAWSSTGSSEYLGRAEEVAAQFLAIHPYDLASERHRFPCHHFRWNLEASSPTAIGIPESCDGWDVADAPRALWSGDAVRAFHLVSGGVTHAVFEDLAQWSRELLRPSFNTTTCGCYRFHSDGNPVSGFCQPGYLYLAYTSGLQLFTAPASVETRLEATLDRYLWDVGRWDIQNEYDVPTMSNFGCFFIYDGVRGLKLLAAAIGLDEAIYTPPTGPLFSDGFESGDASAWAS